MRVQPGGAADERHVEAVGAVGDVVDSLAVVERLRVAGRRPLDSADVDPGRLDLGKKLVNRLVTRRGDADSLAGGQQPGDQPSRHPGLARAGRSLDHQVPAVEPEHELGHLAEIRRLDVTRERLAAQHRLDRRKAPVAGEQRAADPLQRILLRIGVERSPGDQCPRQRLFSDRGPSAEREHPRLAVDLDHPPSPAPLLVERLRADPHLVLLWRIGEAMDLRPRVHLRLADRLEQADRVGVLDQLLGRLLDPVEERPPDRLALALVVVEKLRRELFARVEQLLAESGASDLRRGRLLRLLRRGQRERAELRQGFAAPLEQPVAEREGGEAVLLVVVGDRVEDRAVARLDVALVLDDRRAAVLDLGVPVEAEKRLDLLEPVTRTDATQPALDHLVEVDEDAAPQQVVDLRLARAVPAHQPPERGDLVARVMVDVEVGVLGEPRADAVDELLERAPLGLVIVGEKRLERALDVDHPPQVLERALLVPERVALDVEEEVTGRRSGRREKPARGCGSSSS